ncbi:hypothetical protein CPT_Pollock14 [Escherichia phage Pollock]|uniref:Macro domain-containing protein n=1 Tax=Escherichia phage Pollock TaxID=1540097 RepID=A0A0A0YU37_9CAUD|nr:phosphatase [Escherichia phage Pollock]AIX12373.1 hypothetical protein CPT_Pollock14 [Escherichia phage Pollock]
MLEARGNMLEMDCDALCITTNGFVKSNGASVMGAGIAKQVRIAIPGIDKILGQKIAREGNNVHPIINHNNIWIVSFPVKPITEISNGSNFVKHKYFPEGTTVPGWACKANINLIVRSCHQLVKLANQYGWQKVLLPRPGCGAGELNWNYVKKVIEPLLDDRFIVCTY